MLRIQQATPLSGYQLRLTLSDGSVVERDVERLLRGVLEPIRRDPELFRRVRVERGPEVTTGSKLAEGWRHA